MPGVRTSSVLFSDGCQKLLIKKSGSEYDPSYSEPLFHCLLQGVNPLELPVIVLLVGALLHSFFLENPFHYPHVN